MNEQQKGLAALAIATVTEFAGLFLWVQLVDTNQIALGITALTIGLLLERVAVYMTIQSFYGANPPHPNILWNLVWASLLEILAWLIWLYLADQVVGPIWAAVIFGVIILLLHSYQIGYFKRIGAFTYVTDRITIIFSALEAVTAYYWLFLVRDYQPLFGAAVLFIGLTVEHIIQSVVLEPRPGELKKV